MFFVKNSVAWQEYFDKVYIFDDVNYEAFVLEDVSAFIWKALEKHHILEQILSLLIKKYPTTDKMVLENDLEEFLDSLIEANLVVKK